MRRTATVVLGGGVAGLAAAVGLARGGHQVTVLERDEFEPGPPGAAPGWSRRGVPHFNQPHAFVPRGRVELRRHFPDVYSTLLAAGSVELDMRPKLPGPTGPADADLQYLAVRRPVLEWALRRAAAAEPGLTVRPATVRGLRASGGTVTGVRVDGGGLDADLVVDALGRRSPGPRWLAEAGLPVPLVRGSDCGVAYYSRYYQRRPGFELPDGPWLVGPRGDLGQLAFAGFPGDAGSFAVLLAVPPGQPRWQVLREPAAFEAALAAVPALRSWVDPAGTEPITPVQPMAGLRNTLVGAGPARGYVAVGDAACHLDPTLAHGLSFAIAHAGALRVALDGHADGADAVAAFRAATGPELAERYELATALGDQRLRRWLGEPIDLTRREPAYELFSTTTAGVAANRDPELFRVFVRRMGLLDRTGVLDGDVALQRRFEDTLATLPRPAPAGPAGDELLELARAAAAPAAA